MLITLEEDGCLHSYESPTAVTLAVEALDAEQTFRAIFDDAGVPYRIEWLRPNRESSLLGFRVGRTNGEYRLVPAGPADRSAMATMMRASTGPIPAEIAALLAALGLA